MNNVSQNSTSVKQTHFTDLGNAKRLVERYGDKIKYVSQWGWMVWDDQRWQRDETGQVTHFAKETILSLYQEAAEVEDDTQRREIIDHARRSESAFHIKGMIELTQSEREVVARVEDFDADPFLLTVINGTINLKTKELRPHNPKDFITKLAPVNYDPSAYSDVWKKFIADITDNDEELQEYLQRAVGYSLTGSTKEEVFFIAHGSGRNGKSKFLEAVQNIMGDYAQDTPSRTFMRKEGSGGPTNDLAVLAGARLVTTIETEGGKALDVNTVKQITGGDKITARMLYKENFTFKPQLKLWMATNNKPEISEDSVAIWARIKLIPFTVDFRGREDKNLSEKLMAVTPSVLSWAVEGCMKWQQDGLKEPESVRAAVQDYQEEQDVIADFLTERCEIGSNLKIKARELYTGYKTWCETNSAKAITETEFGTKIASHGFKKKRDSAGRQYVGIALKDPKENIHPLRDNDSFPWKQHSKAAGGEDMYQTDEPEGGYQF